MKNLIIYIFFLLFVTASSYSGERRPFTVWAEASRGNTFDYGIDLVKDADGNIYITGVFAGTINFDGNTLESNEYYDVFIAKFDSSGRCLWAKSCGSELNDGVSDIMLNSENNLIISGHFFQTAEFGPFTLESAGSSDMYIAGISTNGEWIFARNYGGYGSEICRKVLETENNKYLIIGGFLQSFRIGDFDVFNLKNEDGLLVLFDKKWSPEWVRTVGGPDTNIVADAEIFDQEIVITGYTKRETRFNEYILSPANPDETPFVCKYSMDGDVEWLTAPVTSLAFSEAIDIDNQGNIFICGNFYGFVNWDTVNILSTNTDGFVLSLDKNGKVKWGKKFRSDFYSIPTSINCNEKNALYVTGTYSGTIPFETDTIHSVGQNNIFLAKMLTNGNVRWILDAGGDNQVPGLNDIGYSVKTEYGDYSTEIYTTGAFTGNADFGDSIKISSGTNSSFLWKIMDSRSYSSVTVGSSSAEQSSEIQIPVYFNSVPELNLKETDSISFDISYKFSMLFPLNSDKHSVRDDIRTSSYKVPFSLFSHNETENVFALLDFKVGLGNDTITDLQIKNIRIESDFFRVINSKNGKFNLKDFCREGGPRLIEPYGALKSIEVLPNPVSLSSTISIEMTKQELVSIYIFDNSGAEISSMKDLNLNTGMNEFNGHKLLSILPSGNYYLVARSDSGMGAIQIQKN